jgi:hypothetical protein
MSPLSRPAIRARYSLLEAFLNGNFNLMAHNKVFVLLFALPKSFCLHDLLFSNDPCHFPIRASPFDNKKHARVTTLVWPRRATVEGVGFSKGFCNKGGCESKPERVTGFLLHQSAAGRGLLPTAVTAEVMTYFWYQETGMWWTRPSQTSGWHPTHPCQAASHLVCPATLSERYLVECSCFEFCFWSWASDNSHFDCV